MPRGQVVARLCDVAPDGSSTLVTRGVLNMSARHGRDRALPWPFSWRGAHWNSRYARVRWTNQRTSGLHIDHFRGTGAGGAARRELGTRACPDGLGFTEDALETYTRERGISSPATRSLARRAKRFFSAGYGRNRLNGQPISSELEPLPDLPLLRMPVNWVTHTRACIRPDAPPSPLASSAS
nr:CocE/NonD family hydrolase C-terminal non-catalytic domain-containing protein [Streptomyces cyaneus]